MATKKEMLNPTKIITGVCRLSYANIWQAKSINGGTPKFSTSVLIPKSDAATVAKVKAAIQAAYAEGEGKLKGNGKTVPPLASLKTPLRDGDTERPDDEAYAGHWFINANSNTAPGVVDINRQPILETSERARGRGGGRRNRAWTCGSGKQKSYRTALRKGRCPRRRRAWRGRSRSGKCHRLLRGWRQRDTPALSMLKTLLAVMPYTGVGAKAAMGLGAVEVQI